MWGILFANPEGLPGRWVPTFRTWAHRAVGVGHGLCVILMNRQFGSSVECSFASFGMVFCVATHPPDFLPCHNFHRLFCDFSFFGNLALLCLANAYFGNAVSMTTYTWLHVGIWKVWWWLSLIIRLFHVSVDLECLLYVFFLCCQSARVFPKNIVLFCGSVESTRKYSNKKCLAVHCLITSSTQLLVIRFQFGVCVSLFIHLCFNNSRHRVYAVSISCALWVVFVHPPRWPRLLSWC